MAKRGVVQGLWTLVTNSYVLGFAQGKIYQGPLKNLCLPGLNCYSCPGALASCPLGALQSVMGSRSFSASFFVMGFFVVLGVLMGRFVCGWLCPFGWVQDLLHKIPFIKKIRTFKGDMLLRWLKLVILAVFVLLLPLFAVDIVGQGAPYFCKYICPSGTLFGGLPLVALNEPLQNIIGGLFAWKNAVLLGIVLLSLMIYRPFCKYLCPLGAIYSVFNGISLVRMDCDREKCIDCGACERACRMAVDPRESPNHRECIRCGDCKKACPVGALSGVPGAGKTGQSKCGPIGRSA